MAMKRRHDRHRQAGGDSRTPGGSLPLTLPEFRKAIVKRPKAQAAPIVKAPARMGRPPLPRPSRTATLRLYRVEGTVRGLARRLGLSLESTTRTMRAYGIKPRPIGRPERKLTRAERVEVRRLIREKGIQAAVKRFGMSQSTLYRKGIKVDSHKV